MSKLSHFFSETTMVCMRSAVANAGDKLSSDIARQLVEIAYEHAGLLSNFDKFVFKFD
jgi:hypothetical protein